MNIRELALGIDIGGTNIEIGFCDQAGSLHFEKSFKTKSFATIENLVDTLYEYTVSIDILKYVIGIGIGVPNGNYLTGSIDFAPNLPWHGQIFLARLFEQKFAKRSFLTNDANAAALGEKIYGVGKKYNDFISITLGTGLGSGIIVQNNLLYGSQGLAGEFGHIRVARDGRMCGCGRKGCLEAYASSTGVVRSINELRSAHRSESTLLDIPEPTAKNVFEAAKKGDLFAQEIVDYTANILGEALADFACFSDPEAFILFGGIAQSGPTFADKVQQSMESHILNIYKNRIQIEISGLHDQNAAVLGASSLVWTNLT